MADSEHLHILDQSRPPRPGPPNKTLRPPRARLLPIRPNRPATTLVSRRAVNVELTSC